jgi:hypothetical protein
MTPQTPSGHPKPAAVADWLTRCRWLATTELNERTRARLDDLISGLEQDLEGDEMLPQRRFGGWSTQ